MVLVFGLGLAEFRSDFGRTFLPGFGRACVCSKPFRGFVWGCLGNLVPFVSAVWLRVVQAYRLQRRSRALRWAMPPLF